MYLNTNYLKYLVSALGRPEDEVPTLPAVILITANGCAQWCRHNCQTGHRGANSKDKTKIFK